MLIVHSNSYNLSFNFLTNENTEEYIESIYINVDY